MRSNLAIPTKDEFLEHDSILDSAFNGDLLSKDTLPELAFEKLFTFVSDIRKIRDDKLKLAGKTPVGLWLLQQPAYDRATRVLRGTKEKSSGAPIFDERLWIEKLVPTLLECFEDSTKEFALEVAQRQVASGRIPESEMDTFADDWLERLNSNSAKEDRFFRRLKGRLFPRNGLTPERVIAAACYRYFYDPDRYVRLLYERKKFPEAINTLLEAVNEVLTFEVFDYQSLPLKELRALPRQLENVIDRFPKAPGIIARGDPAARERLYVFDLAFGFKAIYRNPKVSAVCYLLQIEGIDINLSQRSVERLVSKHVRGRRQ